MARTISAMYRYPVKGLSAEPVRSAHLQHGCAFPGDRRYAITHRNSKFDHQQPAWIARRHFTVLAYSPSLARLQAVYDQDTHTIKLACEGRSWQIGIHDSDANALLCQVLTHLNVETQPGPYRLVEVAGVALTDSPEPLISLMNSRSIEDLQKTTGFTLEHTRFRGNLWYEGQQAWEERHWAGKVLSIGGARLRVVEEIVRCSAIDVNPLLGERDLMLLNRLGGIYGHSCFGVLAEVLHSGTVTTGDVITETNCEPYGPLGI